MTSIGDTLRSERLRRGLKLEQVAAETKIGVYYLKAMEDDKFDRLPGGVLTRSFLRQYAHKLSLDEDEVITSLKQQFEPPAEPLPAPQPKRRLPHLPQLLWVVVAIFACIGVYRLWQHRQRTLPKTDVSIVSPRPAPEGIEHASSERRAAPGMPAEPPKSTFRPAVTSDSRTRSLPPGFGHAVASESGSVSDEARTMRVSFTATEPVWVSIKSDGNPAYSGTLAGRQSKEFRASAIMTVLVGNARGLEISLNGKPVGPIGGRDGIQLLVLTPKGAYVVPRMPRAVSDDEDGRP